MGVYFLDQWENKHIKSLFNWAQAILLAYIIPALISFVLHPDFSQGAIQNYNKSYFVLLAIIAVMSSLSLGQLKSIEWKPIVLFVAGSLVMATLPVLLAIGFWWFGYMKHGNQHFLGHVDHLFIGIDFF